VSRLGFDITRRLGFTYPAADAAGSPTTFSFIGLFG
jgi:hypothetical protein